MSCWLLGFEVGPLASYFGGDSGLLGSLAEAASAMGMSIKWSAWGFGVAYGSYSGDEAGDLTGISFGESGSSLMDSLALGIAGFSGKMVSLDSLVSLVVASGSTGSAMAAGACCLFWALVGEHMIMYI